MTDREKVITGFDICLSRFHCGEDCPYYNAESRSGCMELLRKDALELLKEQETTLEKDGHHIRCVKCNSYWCTTDREGNAFPMNYCPECGRKVKWNDN